MIQWSYENSEREEALEAWVHALKEDLRTVELQQSPSPDCSGRLGGEGGGTKSPAGPPTSDTEDEITAASGAWGDLAGPTQMVEHTKYSPCMQAELVDVGRSLGSGQGSPWQHCSSPFGI